MFLKFPSIEQFRQVVREVTDRARYIGKDKDGKAIIDNGKELPTVSFAQTTKIHGTNGGVTLTQDGTLEVQSRNRLLSEDDDNNGFYKWAMQREAIFRELLSPYLLDTTSQVTVFGEFAGESIQKGVAVSQLPKAFYVFDMFAVVGEEVIRVEDFLHNFHKSDSQIFPIAQFGSSLVDIDFNCPDEFVNGLIDNALAVEKQCPVGAYFGVDGVGEGVVLVGTYKDKTFRFKVKGEKHAVSKVKTLSEVDMVELANIDEFVSQVVTDNRLNQGVDYLKETGQEVGQKSIGAFIKWVVSDVRKEENDIIQAKGFDDKKLNKAITNNARKWFVTNFL